MSQTNTLQMTNNNLKYLIAGTGGVGGSIAGFLALAGKDVTCIARGEHRRSRFLVSRLQGRRYLRMRQRLFRRLHYGTNQTRRTQRYGGNPHSERLRHRASHPAAGSRRYGTGRLHLHRRIRFRQRRNHTDGKNIPFGLRSPQRHRCFP